MARRSPWLAYLALTCAAVYAAIVSVTALSDNSALAAPDSTSALPFSTTALPEITSLKPVPGNPTSLDDFRAIQARVEAVVQHVLPAVVAVSIREGPEVEQGSGVIVSKDGYILTAGHVSGTPKTSIRVIMSNNHAVDGFALGADTQIDSGMIKIDTQKYPADYPSVPLGDSSHLRAGQWVIALGHPGGYQPGRPPVVRIGRVLKVPDPRHGDPSRGRTEYIQTDCELIMGDSGGPVFDLDGRLVGINSRIGQEVSSNIHVPINAFSQNWRDLAAGRLLHGNAYAGLFGAPPALPPEAAHGSLNASIASNLQILQVFDGGAAEHAHLSPGDIITKVNGQPLKSLDDLIAIVGKLAPGKSIKLEYLRDNKASEVSLTLMPANP